MNSILVNCRNNDDAEALCYLLATEGCHGAKITGAALLDPYPILVVRFDGDDNEDLVSLLKLMDDYVLDATLYYQELPPLPEPPEISAGQRCEP